MAKQNAKEAAKEYAVQVAAKIKDEGKRKAFLEALEDDAVLDDLGGGVLRQSDYTRLAQEVKTAEDRAKAAEATANAKTEEVSKWYAEQVKLKENPPADPANPPAVDLSKLVTREDFAKAVAAAQVQANQTIIGWQKVLIPLSTKHYHEYKEVLDVDGLIEFAGKNRIPVDQAYSLFTADKRAAVEKEAQATRDAKLIKDTEDRVRSEFAGLPHLLPGKEPLGTLGGLLDSPTGKPSLDSENLVAELNKITAERIRKEGA